jgi:adenosylmethionine-8-amino-7-oxononanoate aminotransferase
VTRDEIVRRDKAHVWHPYTPMDAWAAGDPIVVARAEGARLYDPDGRSYLDGNASWWTAALGHGHPRILRALREQAERFAHVALAGITHEPAAALASELVAIAPVGLNHVFYTDNGSTAVEAAIKACVQSWAQSSTRAGRRKSRFVALEGAFHGDTVGAASLGGVEIFRRPFGAVLFDVLRVPSPTPTTGEARGAQDSDPFLRAFDALRALLEKDADDIAAVFIEPVVQGAAGMRTYDPTYLHALRGLCDRHDVLLVFDEVFTGYGRTGPMWAAVRAGVAPDVMCIGKAFCPVLPMGAMLASDRIEVAFRGARDRAFLYGHTFCGNPLGAAVAREVLAVYRDEDVLGQVARKAPVIERAFERIAQIPGVARARSMGMIGAADLSRGPGEPGGYLGEKGWKVWDAARARGAYLRPLGDTVYVTPPLTIPDADLDQLLAILEDSVRVTMLGR